MIVIGRHLHRQLSIACEHAGEHRKNALVIGDPMQRGV
jgi:hypothetical protein